MELSKKSIITKIKKIIKSVLILFYLVLLVSLIIGGIYTGIITLIPDEASKPCYLRYYAHCSFTPYSTLIGFAMILIGSILMLKLIKYLRRKNSKVIDTEPILKSLIKK